VASFLGHSVCIVNTVNRPSEMASVTFRNFFALSFMKPEMNSEYPEHGLLIFSSLFRANCQQQVKVNVVYRC